MACERHNEDLPFWKHPWVCMADSHSDDEPAIWVWVNEILLDSSNEALVLDCCIMPVDRMDDPASLQLKESIAIQDATSVIAAKVLNGSEWGRMC